MLSHPSYIIGEALNNQGLFNNDGLLYVLSHPSYIIGEAMNNPIGLFIYTIAESLRRHHAPENREDHQSSWTSANPCTDDTTVPQSSCQRSPGKAISSLPQYFLYHNLLQSRLQPFSLTTFRHAVIAKALNVFS